LTELRVIGVVVTSEWGGLFSHFISFRIDGMSHERSKHLYLYVWTIKGLNIKVNAH